MIYRVSEFCYAGNMWELCGNYMDVGIGSGGHVPELRRPARR
jgi:hypothetical protein